MIPKEISPIQIDKPVIQEQRTKIKIVHIKVDGSPILFPKYAPNLSAEELLWYLVNTDQVREYGYWGIAAGGTVDVENFDPNIFTKMQQDPYFLEYYTSLLKHGPDKNFGFYEWDFEQCAVCAADNLWKEEKGLEIERKAEPLSPKDPDKNTNSRRMGNGLRHGLLIYNGDLEYASCSGGSLFVRGNIELIDDCNGVIYIDGNISKLGNVENTAVIVTGKIKEWEMKKGHTNQVLKSKRIPSPFIFAPHDVNVLMKGSRILFSSGEDNDGYFYSDEAFKAAYVVSLEELIGWKPEEIRERAMELCLKRTGQALIALKNIASNLEDPKDLIKFWNRFFFGWQKGFESGRASTIGERVCFID